MSENDRFSKPRVVTQRDVALAAGVDRATVSRALDPNKRLMISSETLERVLQAADSLNYQTNVLARGLRTSKSGIVGLEVPSPKSSIGTMFDKSISVLVSSVEEKLAKHDMTLLVTFESETEGRGAGERFSRSGMIDGLIRVPSRGLTQSQGGGQVPSVSIGFDADESFDVVIHEARGIEIAVEHLQRLGHRRIALISEPPSYACGERHVRAYRTSMEKLGLLSPTELPMTASYHSRHPASAPEAVTTILQRSPGPTALIFTDDKAAMSGYGTLRSSRIQLPESISVIGWGDSDAGLFLLPPLTTIAIPMRAAAFAAADLLIDRISGIERGTAASRLPKVLDPYLIQRASTGVPPHA